MRPEASVEIKIEASISEAARSMVGKFDYKKVFFLTFCICDNYLFL